MVINAMFQMTDPKGRVVFGLSKYRATALRDSFHISVLKGYKSILAAALAGKEPIGNNC